MKRWTVWCIAWALGGGCRGPGEGPLVVEPKFVSIGIVDDDPEVYALLGQAGITHSKDGSILYALLVPQEDADRALAILLRNRVGKSPFWFMTLREYGEFRALTEGIQGALRNAQHRLESGYLEHAIGAFTAAIRITPREPLYCVALVEGYLGRTKAFEKKGDTASAIAGLEEGIRLAAADQFVVQRLRARLDELRRWLEWVDMLLTMIWEQQADWEFDEFRSEWVRILMDGGKAAPSLFLGGGFQPKDLHQLVNC
jgi:hypothetical protein